MLGIIALLASASLHSKLPPAPPPFTHARNSISRLVVTEFTCEHDSSVRSFTLQYDDRGFKVKFLVGKRNGKLLSPQELRDAQRGLDQLRLIGSVFPQCSDKYDLLTVHGTVNGKKALIFLSWDENGIRASKPQLIGDQ